MNFKIFNDSSRPYNRKKLLPRLDEKAMFIVHNVLYLRCLISTSQSCDSAFDVGVTQVILS